MPLCKYDDYNEQNESGGTGPNVDIHHVDGQADSTWVHRERNSTSSSSGNQDFVCLFVCVLFFYLAECRAWFNVCTPDLSHPALHITHLEPLDTGWCGLGEAAL